VSQPEFCVSFATAAAILSASNLVMVGPNTDTMCLLRPWIFNRTLLSDRSLSLHRFF